MLGLPELGLYPSHLGGGVGQLVLELCDLSGLSPGWVGSCVMPRSSCCPSVSMDLDAADASEVLTVATRSHS